MSEIRSKREMAHDPLMSIVNISTPRNSIFTTLSFDKSKVEELTQGTIKAAYRHFMAELIRVSGLPPSSIAHGGIYLACNKDGEVAPHIHALAYSTKSRKTGTTIARLTQVERKKLGRHWEDHPLALNLKILSVWNAEGLAIYFTGPNNTLAPGQEWWPLPVFNSSLAQRKANRKQRLRQAA